MRDGLRQPGQDTRLMRERMRESPLVQPHNVLWREHDKVGEPIREAELAGVELV
jgi:hypothetical protein